MLNFNRLRILYHAAKNLNFTAAAGDLFITQPAVTAQIKLLEEYCELKLFRKKGRGVCLTDEGRDLFVRADKILPPPARAFLENLTNLSGGDLPALGIGALIAKIRATVMN